MTATTTRAAECWARILAQPDGMSMGYAADFARDDGSEPAEACAAVEAVAQQHLDAHPDDHRARRLLGEWLQWHGDGRGEGYRAFSINEMHPMSLDGYWGWLRGSLRLPGAQWMPFDWYEFWQALSGGDFHPTRRAAEDAAGLAFARLPVERRAQLLKGEM